MEVVLNDVIYHCLLLCGLYHCGGFVVILQHIDNWPFPSKDNPLTPWTPEQQRDYEQQQRAKMPDSPMIGV